MKSSNVGGQAVMEGIMMRHGSQYSVAVRKENKEIEIKTEEHRGIIKSRTLLRIPFIRGVFNFVDSMVLGMQTLTYSASFFEEEETDGQGAVKETAASAEASERKEKIMMGLTVALSILLAVGIFMLLPYFMASFLRRLTNSAVVIAIAEGVLRILIFVGYILAISLMKDIQRFFMYHGAEHKCINCIEHGLELNVANVRGSSKQHKRCGTSFLLFVMIISIVFGFFIRVESPFLRVAIRVLLLPLIAGVSYEIIKLAGRSESRLVAILSKPGMWMQNLTTREPDDEMIEVGIAAVEAVFDWKEYIRDNFGKNVE